MKQLQILIILSILLLILIGCDSKPQVEYPIDYVKHQKLIKIIEAQKIECERQRIEYDRTHAATLPDSLRIEQENLRILDLKNTIKIINVYTSEPNSASGVDIHTIWKNTSNKTIKYISFYWTPYNAVNDEVPCLIRGFKNWGGKVTGPIKPGQVYGYGRSWECLWYNNTIKRATLDKIEIEYMDGTSKIIEYYDIEYVYKKQIQ